MPRIVPEPNWDAMLNADVRRAAAWLGKGNASTAYDICDRCARYLGPPMEGPPPWPATLELTGGEPPIENGWLAVKGSEHPPYAGGNYTCRLCADPLTAEDD